MSELQILLAEDNPGDTLLVEQALTEHGVPYRLHVARDGAEAIAFIMRMGDDGGTPCPDVVLLDLNLPKIDGTEVLAELREHPKGAAIPVVIITSSDADKDRVRTAELGIAHYFRKPSDLDEFMQLGAIIRAIAERRVQGPV